MQIDFKAIKLSQSYFEQPCQALSIQNFKQTLVSAQQDQRTCILSHFMSGLQKNTGEKLHSRLALYTSQTTSFCFLRQKHLPIQSNVFTPKWTGMDIDSRKNETHVFNSSDNTDGNFAHYIALRDLSQQEIVNIDKNDRMRIYDFCLNIMRILYCRGFYLYGNDIAQYFIIEVKKEFLISKNSNNQKYTKKMYDNLEIQVYKPILTKQVQFVEQLVKLRDLLKLSDITMNVEDAAPVDKELFLTDDFQIKQSVDNVNICQLCKEIYELDDIDFIQFEQNGETQQEVNDNFTRKYFFNETQLSNEQILFQYMRALYQKRNPTATIEETDLQMATMHMDESEQRPVWILLTRMVLGQEGVKNYECIPDWLHHYVKYDDDRKQLPEIFLTLTNKKSQEFALKNLRIILGMYPEKVTLNIIQHDFNEKMHFDPQQIETAKKLPIWLRNKIFQMFYCLLKINPRDNMNEEQEKRDAVDLGDGTKLNEKAATLWFDKDEKVMRRIAYQI